MPSSYQQPAFPQHTPFVDEFGYVTPEWRYFLVSCFELLGGSQAAISSQVYILNAGANTYNVFSSSTKQLIGTFTAAGGGGAGGAAQVQVLAGSPFGFVATKPGTLIIDSGKVEISRDGGLTWFVVGLMGSALPLLINDRARVTWFSAIAPDVTFLPQS